MVLIAMDTKFIASNVLEDDVHNVPVAMSHGWDQGMGSQAIAVRKVCSVVA
jgi:hypothetical protein